MAGNQGKGAIFDLDGTLLDSMGVWDQVDIDFLSKRGIDVPDDYMTESCGHAIPSDRRIYDRAFQPVPTLPKS